MRHGYEEDRNQKEAFLERSEGLTVAGQGSVRSYPATMVVGAVLYLNGMQATVAEP